MTLNQELNEKLEELQKLKLGKSGNVVIDPMIVDKSFLTSFEDHLMKLKTEGDSLSISNVIKTKDVYSVTVRLSSGKEVELLFDISDYQKMRKKARVAEKEKTKSKEEKTKSKKG